MNNLILIGLPGSGKTTVGRLLSARLGLPFRDCDELVAAQAGLSIPVIFAREGEAGFRRRERACLASLCRGEGQVISTGGGAVLLAENRCALREDKLVVFLDREVEDIMATIPLGEHPLLSGDDPQGQLERLREQRLPFYLECAGLCVCAATAEDAARIIVDYWEAMP